jgi:hypothetical protein
MNRNFIFLAVGLFLYFIFKQKINLFGVERKSKNLDLKQRISETEKPIFEGVPRKNRDTGIFDIQDTSDGMGIFREGTFELTKNVLYKSIGAKFSEPYITIPKGTKIEGKFIQSDEVSKGTLLGKIISGFSSPFIQNGMIAGKFNITDLK